MVNNSVEKSKDVAIKEKSIIESAPDNVTQDQITVMYHGASSLTLKPEEQTALQKPVDRDNVEIRPDGLIYLPQVFVRDALNKTLGIGQWALIQHNTMLKDGFMYFDGSLVVRGKFVARAMGEQKYHTNNEMQSYASAYEAAKSDCLVRCCKDMGIAKELWQPKYGREWKKEFAVKVFVKNKAGKTTTAWRRKDVEPAYNETGEVPEGENKKTLPECPKCKSNKAVIIGKKEYGGGFLCYKAKNGCGHKWQAEQKEPAKKTSASAPDKSRPSPDFSQPPPPKAEHGKPSLTVAQKISMRFNEIAAKTPLNKKEYRNARLDLLTQLSGEQIKSAKNLGVPILMKILEMMTKSPERIEKFISQFIDNIIKKEAK